MHILLLTTNPHRVEAALRQMHEDKNFISCYLPNGELFTVKDQPLIKAVEEYANAQARCSNYLVFNNFRPK